MNNRQARILEEVLRAPGNDNCADCHAPAPRWASVNLGIFLCVQCASVHRKMGTHTSRVKSVTLDTWTREQVDAMRQIGNVKANAEWNPNERLHPPPTNTGDVERDSDLERYIRLKYEAGRFKAPVREAKREVKPNPELRDNIASRPKTSPLPDLPPEDRAGRATAPPRQRPTPRAVDLVQTALASTSTLPLQMAPQVQVQMQLQSPYQMQMQMQQQQQMQMQMQQQQQMQMQQTYQPQQYQQYQQPYQQHQQQSQQQYQSPHQPYQNVQGQLAQQYPQFPPAGSYYGGQLFNSVAPQTGQQGFARGMMPPR